MTENLEPEPLLRVVRIGEERSTILDVILNQQPQLFPYTLRNAPNIDSRRDLKKPPGQLSSK